MLPLLLFFPADPCQQVVQRAGLHRLGEMVVEASAQGEIIGLDPDYYKLFDQAYADGARLHTNSWGDTTSAAPGPGAPRA